MCLRRGLAHVCRGRIRRSLCDFAGAEADFRAVLAVKPANTAAEKELDGATRGLQALEAARLARSVNQHITLVSLSGIHR